MDLDLSLDLNEQQILKRFDELVTNGTVIYNHDYRIVGIKDKGLSFEFRILSGMSQKPSYTNADGTYKTSAEVKAEPVTLTGCKPGSDINVAGYEVGTLGDHVLAFNKFPAARPHFLILTADGYRRQYEALDGDDIWAMWVVMGKFNGYVSVQTPGQHINANGTNGDGKRKQRHISFFNCGLKSGCSRLHKHMQVFPIVAEYQLEQEGEEGGENEFKLWPDIEDPEFYEEALPFKVAMARFKEGDGPVTKERLLETYQALLKEAEGWLRESFEKEGDGDENGINVPGWVEKEHRENSGKDREKETVAAIPHNVILDKDWMVVIPRRAAGWKGGDCNAISMLGMNWVSGEDKIEKWVGLGPAEVLRRVGVPVRG